MTTRLLVRGATLAGRTGLDVRARDGVIVEVGAALRRDQEEVVEAGGATLLPGLHDHHLHLHAVAADLDAVRCGPPAVRTVDDLARALRAAADTGPVRGTGYHESVAGPLDRHVLDALVAAVPVRVQHRSGAAWFLNSAAVEAAGLAAVRAPAVERDDGDRPTGRLWRGDRHLRGTTSTLPDLTRVGRLLGRFGVTGVTDATPDLEPGALAAIRTAHASGDLPQRPLLLGAPLGDPAGDVGPWKVVLDEASGLDLDALLEVVRSCRAHRRAVAIHAVTRAEAVVAVSALRSAGSLPGDRLEHGSVVPHPLDQDLCELGITVVTQPHFIAERGEDYLADVDDPDLPLLYRCRSLLDAGVAVGAGTDAPYGRLDPWQAVAAAVTRRTHAGRVLGTAERVTPARALALFLAPADEPGGAPRRVAPGAAADLCLIDAPLDVVVREPGADHVLVTIVAGRVVYDREVGR